MTKARWISLVVLVVVVAFVAVLANRPAVDGNVSNPLVGKEAPPVAGQAIDDRQVDLASLRGRWTVVNFFATWCIECRREHPELIEFSERYKDPQDPALVAVAFDRNDISATRSYFAQNGGEWPVLPDRDGSIAINYGVRGLPETFVVDPEGRIAARIKGEVTADGLAGIIGAGS